MRKLFLLLFLLLHTFLCKSQSSKLIKSVSFGGVAYSRWLSRQRSSSVIQRLRQLDIPEEGILIQDNGQENPFFDNNTFQGQRATRRVDIILSPLYF